MKKTADILDMADKGFIDAGIAQKDQSLPFQNTTI